MKIKKEFLNPETLEKYGFVQEVLYKDADICEYRKNGAACSVLIQRVDGDIALVIHDGYDVANIDDVLFCLIQDGLVKINSDAQPVTPSFETEGEDSEPSVEREELIKEAVQRMQLLKLSPAAIDAFEKTGKVFKSEDNYVVPLNAAEEQIIADYEKEYDSIVYHIIHMDLDTNEQYALLYISDELEEWEMDREDFGEGKLFCYLVNRTFPDASEHGMIGVEPVAGSLKRVM